jgi:hypothetical protein
MRVIPTFGDEPLTNTVSTLCPRCFATTPRHLLLEKDAEAEGGWQGVSESAMSAKRVWC